MKNDLKFKEGDVVYDRWYPESKGIIVNVGVRRCRVLFDKSPFNENPISYDMSHANKFLIIEMPLNPLEKLQSGLKNLLNDKNCA